nr:DUF3348 domain-containing protein [Dechloromonas sp.]
MATGMTGSTLNSARLVRVLASLAVAEVGESKLSFAERLGQWLDFTDAMSLFSALNEGAGGASAATKQGADAALFAEFDRVRRSLAESITTDGVLNPGRARIKLPTPAPNASPESAADFSPYHRYCLAHQRDMGAAIAPLRAAARTVLAARSPALKQLATLDAVLEQALANRERNLLASVPLLLAKRFGNLYKAHRAAWEGPVETDDPALWMQPEGWLAGYCGEMQAVLLAELDVRLQPVAGLVEALGKEVTE